MFRELTAFLWPTNPYVFHPESMLNQGATVFAFMLAACFLGGSIAAKPPHILFIVAGECPWSSEGMSLIRCPMWLTGQGAPSPSKDSGPSILSRGNAWCRWWPGGMLGRSA